MYVPKWMIEKIEGLNSSLRLGYYGGIDLAVIQLLPVKVAEATLIGNPWNNRGPIYGTKFDRVTQVPMHIVDLPIKEVFYDFDSVYSKLKRWLRPFKERVLEDAAEEGREYEDGVRELAEELGDYLYWHANQTGSGGVEAMPKKFLTPEEKEVLNGDAREKNSLVDSFMPNTSVGGALR